MSKRPPLPRTVWVLGIVSLLMDLSSEIYHALLPAFLTVTLGLPVAAMGALDGISEATANMAKLVSGKLSDHQQRRKPWVLLGYGMAALSKPLFPLANGAMPVLGARFVDRIGKGIRGAPRDAMIADETPPEIRGAAFGLRQSLDTVGAFLAPLVAVGLMIWLAGDIRTVFWIAVIPAMLSFLVAWALLRETAGGTRIAAKMKWGGFRDLDKPVRRLIGIGFLFGLARFSEGFLILKAMDVGLSASLSPLVLSLFALVVPGSCLPCRPLERPDPAAHHFARRDSDAGGGRRVAGPSRQFVDGRGRRRPVGRAHGADPGHFRADDRRCVGARAARKQLRRLLLRQRDRGPARQPRRRIAVGPRRGGGDLQCRGRAGRGGRGDAGAAA